MRFIAAAFLWFPLFLVPALIGFGIVSWVTKKYATRTKIHLACMLLPWFTWIGLMGIDGSGKSLANVVEACILGGFVSLMLIIESTIITLGRSNVKYLPKVTLIVSCLFAVVLWGYFPSFPE
ncbi:hypothetical protein ACNO65_25550 [Vibrio campbellii]|uniref:hypothetical protein n=1 Tax=Vibrio campbellii TaxID=680 RepID=UPI000A6F570B|nr:hypothetical protein [Vibrio campbellii]